MIINLCSMDKELVLGCLAAMPKTELLQLLLVLERGCSLKSTNSFNHDNSLLFGCASILDSDFRSSLQTLHIWLKNALLRFFPVLKTFRFTMPPRLVIPFSMETQSIDLKSLFDRRKLLRLLPSSLHTKVVCPLVQFLLQPVLDSLVCNHKSRHFKNRISLTKAHVIVPHFPAFRLASFLR